MIAEKERNRERERERERERILKYLYNQTQVIQL